MTSQAGNVRLRDLFAGRRGRLLLALLVAEFGAAVQTIAYSSVLPVAAEALHGAGLYGATLAGGSFSAIMVLALGPAPFARLRPRGLLGMATTLYVLGAVLAVAATAMWMITLGTVLRGAASGMLAGLGLSALGGLFDREARTRVYGLFSVVWLVPSFAGPVLNAAITLTLGWRAALGWPVVLVVVGRVLVGRDLDLVPFSRSAAALPPMRWVAALLGALALAAVAPALPGVAAVPGFVVGCVLMAVATLRVLHRQIGPERGRIRLTELMFGLSVAFFGGDGIVALAAMSGLGFGIRAGSVAVGAGLVAWSLTGLRPALADRWLASPVRVGLILVAVGLAAAAVTQLWLSRLPGLVVLVFAWAVAGVGVGLAYARVSSGALDALPPDRLLPVASAVAFAETAGAATGAFVGGGTYSLGSALGWSSRASLALAFFGLTVAAVGAVALSRGSSRTRRRAGSRPGRRSREPAR